MVEIAPTFTDCVISILLILGGIGLAIFVNKVLTAPINKWRV